MLAPIEQHLYSVLILFLLIQSGEIGELRDSICTWKLTFFAFCFDLLSAAIAYFIHFSAALVDYVGFHGPLQSSVIAAANRSALVLISEWIRH